MAPSLSKTEAHYVPARLYRGAQPCRTCSMFRGGRCTLVKGYIEAAGHCRHWKKRENGNVRKP